MMLKILPQSLGNDIFIFGKNGLNLSQAFPIIFAYPCDDRLFLMIDLVVVAFHLVDILVEVVCGLPRLLVDGSVGIILVYYHRPICLIVHDHGGGQVLREPIILAGNVFALSAARGHVIYDRFRLVSQAGRI